MKIEIEQIRDRSLLEYWIKVKEKAHAHAVVRTRGNKYIDVHSLRGMKPEWHFSVKIESGWRKKNYEIQRTDGQNVAFKTVSKKEHIYAFEIGNSTYNVYGHKYSSASIFREEEQIGFLTKKNVVTILNKDKYEFLLDKDVDLEMMATIALIWDDIYSTFFDGLGLSFGQIRQAKAPNYDWKPKD